MKIIAVSEGESLDSYIADDFGHAPFFLLVDSGTMDYRVIENEYMDSPSGAGFAVAEAIVSLGCVDAVLTGGIGMHGVQILEKAGIHVSADEDGTVEECIQDFMRRRGNRGSVRSDNSSDSGPFAREDTLRQEHACAAKHGDRCAFRSRSSAAPNP